MVHVKAGVEGIAGGGCAVVGGDDTPCRLIRPGGEGGSAEGRDTPSFGVKACPEEPMFCFRVDEIAGAELGWILKSRAVCLSGLSCP